MYYLVVCYYETIYNFLSRKVQVLGTSVQRNVYTSLNLYKFQSVLNFK